MSDTQFPRIMHCIDPSGITVLVKVMSDAITSVPAVLAYGDSLEVTEEIYGYSLDTAGKSWMDLDTDGQVRQYGRARFAWDTLPDDVASSIDTTRRRQLETEKSFLLRSNPALARKTSAALRLDELERELAQ